MGVEAGRDQDQLRLEEIGGRQHLVLQQRHPFGLFAAGRDGQVDRESLAGAGAGVVAVAGAGEDPALVDAGEEDVVAFAEDRRGAVAVVDVPVEDQDPLDRELGDRQRGGDGDVVEEAEPHRPVRFRMVPRRPPGAEPHLRLAPDQRPNHRAGASGRPQRRLPGGRAGVGIDVDRATTRFAKLANRLHVRPGMNQHQLLLGGSRSLPPLPPKPVHLLQRRLDSHQPLRPLRMPRQPNPVIVPQAGGMAEIEHEIQPTRRVRENPYTARVFADS